MKIAERVGTVEVSEGVQSKKFRITTNRKMFQLLSGGIYSDTKKAVIRELSTNAADAHVAAGKADVPFTVHLPNQLEPWLSIRDDGVGLSPAQVDEIYTSYGESNKTHSNDFTGCLGLGSKSPFTYADNFTVVSRHDGTQYVYSCFLAEDGAPTIAEMGRTPTTEGNGLEIRLNPPRSDWPALAKAAKEVLSVFAVRPTIIGDPSFRFLDPDYLWRKPSYGIARERTYKSRLIMGNVAYPISQTELRVSDAAANVLQWGVDLYVPIGSADFTASRETLQYSALTCQTIEKACLAVVEDVRQHGIGMVQQAPTLWQARQKLYELRRTVVGDVADLKSVLWNGQVVSTHISVAEGKDGLERIAVLRKAKKLYRAYDCQELAANGTPVFLDDLPKGGIAVIQHFLDSQHNKTSAFYLKADQAFLDRTGVGEVIVRTSSLPKPPAKPRSARGPRVLLTSFAGRRSAPMDSWAPVDEVPEDGGVYVTVYKGHPRYALPEGSGGSVGQLQEIVDSLAALGQTVTVYGVRPSEEKRLKKRSGWVELHDVVGKVVARRRRLADKAVKAAVADGATQLVRKLAEYEWPAGTVLRQVVQEYKDGQAADKDREMNAYQFLHRTFVGPVPGLDAAGQRMEQLDAQIRAAYPLLAHIDFGWRTKPELQDLLTDYIRLVDRELVEAAVA